MNGLKVMILALLLGTALHAQIKPALPVRIITIGGPGDTGTMTAERSLAYLGSLGATSTAATVDSFYLYDAAGHLLVTCKNHDLDTNKFTGCRLPKGRTLDDLLYMVFEDSSNLEWKGWSIVPKPTNVACTKGTIEIDFHVLGYHKSRDFCLTVPEIK